METQKEAHVAPDPRHIADFARLEPWLMRGDQPDTSGYIWLAAHGIRVVVNLRIRNRDKKVHTVAPSLQSIHIPVKNDRPPTQQQALDWLELCRRCQLSRPIFVHCRGGKGRTSTFCALVRAAQGWNLESAIAEQLKFGFDPQHEHRLQAAFLVGFWARANAGLLTVPKL